jgi:hypothetical protein
MKTFVVIESRPVTRYWEYIVEAENETEALNKVIEFDGVEAVDGWEGDNEDNESDFEIYEKIN